ncbi:MAG: PilZ domain-containing protein [Candidatus Omnitrophica bacterium]|nr:PilZ domain-containing protein [Candidatus Omnitrophota bacterium]
MQERRSSRRYPVLLEARVTIVGTQQSYEGKVTDIGFTGVRFVCNEKIEKDQKLELILSIEEQDITLKAVVVWAAKLEDLEGIQHGMQVVGVAFVGDSKKLEKFFKNIQGQ